MKSFQCITLCVATLAVADVVNLNFTKINQVYKQTLERVLGDNHNELGNFFPQASVQIDESSTDLTSAELLRIKGRARLTAKGPVWQPTGEATINLVMAGDANLVQKSASVEIKASLETQTQKLLGFAASFVAPNFCDPKQPPTPTDAEVCRELKAIVTAPNLTGVFARIVNLTAVHTAYCARELKKVAAELAAAAPDKKDYWEKRKKVAEEEHAISSFVQLAFRDALTAAAGTDKFTVKLRDLNFFSNTELREFDFYLTPTQFELGGRLTETDLKDMAAYLKRRDLIVAELTKLQNEDPETKEAARGTLRYLLQTLKSWIAKG